jgi:hypothetical protein
MNIKSKRKKIPQLHTRNNEENYILSMKMSEIKARHESEEMKSSYY